MSDGAGGGRVDETAHALAGAALCAGCGDGPRIADAAEGYQSDSAIGESGQTGAGDAA